MLKTTNIKQTQMNGLNLWKLVLTVISIEQESESRIPKICFSIYVINITLTLRVQFIYIKIRLLYYYWHKTC